MTKTNTQREPIGPRQGDVLLIKIGKLPKGIEPVPADPRGIVIAEGETSAHFHAVIGGGAKLFRFTDRRHTDLVVQLESDAEVHVVGGGSGDKDRHTSGPLPVGNYRARIQRRNDAGRARQVQD